MITDNLSEMIKPSLFSVERVRCDVLKRAKKDPSNEKLYSHVTKSLNNVLSDLIVLDDFLINGGNRKDSKSK